MKEHAARILGGLDRLERSQPDSTRLRREASALLRRYLGFDFAVWATLDPSTVLWTDCILDGFCRDPHLESAIFHNEYGQDDVLKIRDLARAGLAGSLSCETQGRPGASPRFREILEPVMGVTDELRVALSDGESAWGAAVFYRSRGTFTQEEIEAVAKLSRRLGRALRTAVLSGDALLAPQSPLPPGLVLIDHDGRLLEMSSEAERWLRGPDGLLPAAVQALSASARGGESARAVLRSRKGDWLLLRAVTTGSQLAVVVEPAAAHHLSELVLRAYGLTPRERDIVALVARGLPTKEISRALGIGAWTVQDHLKSIFAKVDVDSRSSLVAALFFRHALSHHSPTASAP